MKLGIRAFAAVTIAALGGFLAGCEGSPADGAAHSGPSLVVVEIVDLTPTSVPRLLSAVGTLESPQSTMVASEVSGVVTFLDVPEGGEVEGGRVLARVDSRQERAKLSVARARHKNAREALQRLQSLHERGLVSRQELDNAASLFEQESGALEESKTSLQQTEITAPFTGQLGLREVSLGAFVDAGDPLVRLTQTDPLRLVFTLPERDAGKIRSGQEIRGIAGDCTARFDAAVSIIDPMIDRTTRAVRVQATVSNEQGQLRAGMSARISLEVGRDDGALSVPSEAIVRRGTQKLVYVVRDGDHGIEEREVTTGQHFSDRIELRGGVQAGERVVVTGHQHVRPGSIADPRPYKPVTNPKLALGLSGAACEL